MNRVTWSETSVSGDPGTAFRLLGPLEVVRDGAERAIPAGRQQALLAALLLRPNQVVPAPTLVEQVWGAGADRSTLNVYVMRLRRSLRDGDHALIRSDGPGYRIAVDPATVDLHRFRRLRERALRARADGDRHRERAVLHQALALWRGDALAGIDAPVLQAETAMLLQEERLTAIGQRIGADLECGAHAEVIGELRELVAAHPFRERLWCQLLLALYRSGRQSEALGAFATARRLLTAELGVEPGGELRELHHRILIADPTLAVPGAAPDPRVVPAQLPCGTAGFVGRRDALRQLDRLLDRPGAAPATLVVGPAGIGKTALAVYWADRHRAAWPDGQLYLDLRGDRPDTPMRPIDALAYLLRGMGLPADRVPRDLAEAAALYRSLVADRRALVLLDNAASAAQVRPLLPGGRDRTVVVTSRDPLTDLVISHGARRLPLGALTEPEAVALLAESVGAERVATEPRAAAELAGLCGNQPLRLRVAAADLNGRPERRLADHLARLRRGDRVAAPSAVRARGCVASTANTTPRG